MNTQETLQSQTKLLMLPNPSSLNDTLSESRYVLLAENYQKTLSRPDLPEPFDWVRLSPGPSQR